MASKLTMRQRMKKDKAVRNGVIVGGAMGALVLVGGAVGTQQAAREGEVSTAIGVGGATVLGAGLTAGIWGALAYGATKVFSD